jgi:hypothetical protein
VGVDLINIITFLWAWQEALQEELVIFLYKEGRLLL